MRKLIHSRFELDLSTFKISDTEENNWFSDSFFTKYSFPFDIDLTDDLDVAFDFISLYNTNPQTYFEVKYLHNNQLEDAIFEIESHQEKLSCTLRFGFEQLPSFDKKLSELSLDKFTLLEGTDIYEHAETIITQTWPDVNYNFPQIHTDKYSPDEEVYEFFEKTLNKRVDGNFLINEVIDDISYNRNIMQPLPYWLHILQRGMADAGYTLAGKILEDTRLQRACLLGDVDYFKPPTQLEPLDILLPKADGEIQLNEDGTPIKGMARADRFRKYTFNYTLPTKGKWGLLGDLDLVSYSNFECYITIKYRDTILYQNIFPVEKNRATYYFFRRKKKYIDFTFETVLDLNPDVISIEAIMIDSPLFDSLINVVDLSLYLKTSFSSSGAVPSLINQNEIDLTRSVPDITFGDFIKVVKNWFNYDLSVKGKLAIMNPIEDEINYNNAFNLQFTEVKKPLRKFNQGTSFLLKFQDTDSKDFSYLPVFHNRDSIVNSGYTTDEKTTTIEINALPLPLLVRNEIQTAFAFESNESKVYLVPYNGIYNGNNLSQPIDDYLIPSIHAQYWKKWFDFRINSIPFTWSFLCYYEKILDLKVKDKIFSYNNYHIIKNINRTEIKPNLFEIEMETQALK